MNFIGRDRDRQILREALDSAEPELVAITGRRRVGKTFLVTEETRDCLTFSMTGVKGASLREQLVNFSNGVQALVEPVQSTDASPANHPTAPAAAKDWQSAFQKLTTLLQAKVANDERVVLFFDELPWLASPRSRFMPAFDFFWNDWASKHANVKVIICGSAASWMIERVIRNKGGLYNRVTRRIQIEAFTLAETKAFLESRGVTLSLRQIIEIYMVFGGIPHYLKEVRPGMSAKQNIEASCFQTGGLLQDEYRHLYYSLFEQAERHHKVVEALAGRRRGMTRDQLIKETGLPSGGAFTNVLWELEASGFIGSFTPLSFGRAKKSKPVYVLKDGYTLFYLHWIRSAGPEFDWLQASQGAAWLAWSGLAFETVCFQHMAQIKQALGIRSVSTSSAPWKRTGTKNEPGAEIDLLIDRADDCMNVCEMKFGQGEHVIDAAGARNLRNKSEVLRRVSKTRKALFVTMITVDGLFENQWSGEVVSNEVTAADLFAD